SRDGRSGRALRQPAPGDDLLQTPASGQLRRDLRRRRGPVHRHHPPDGSERGMISRAQPRVHFGVSVRSSYTSWEALRDCGRRVEELGFDSLWTSDHFMGSDDDVDGPTFEGWQLLPAWGALTSRVRIGICVSGNTYRHPAILAKMAATLDH